MEREKKIEGWLRVLLLVLPYFITIIIFQLIGMKIAGIDFSDESKSQTPIQDLIVGLFDLIGALLIIWVFMRFIDKEKFINVGFQLKNRIKDILVGLTLGLVIMISMYSLLEALSEINFIKYNFNLNDFTVLILRFLIVAIVEEVLFRGYILKNLMLSCNKYIALIISAILFAFAHSANDYINTIALIDLFLAGIILGLTYIHTKNLWFPIAFHFSWNFFQSLVGFNVSGHDMYSMIEFSTPKGNILNGGDFGFEGSILSTLISIILIIVIEFYYRKQKNKQWQS